MFASFYVTNISFTLQFCKVVGGKKAFTRGKVMHQVSATTSCERFPCRILFAFDCLKLSKKRIFHPTT
ncbi:MAG: hypothetical protein CL920_35025 [Deltaproteobacteria bacterium]|nr:hypothetical protein [Deltaproteobacteria bacterium]